MDAEGALLWLLFAREQHWRQLPPFCNGQASFSPLKKCFVSLSCCLALEQGRGQCWAISSLLCVCLALVFQMGTQPENVGMQRELVFLEELPHTVPASALGLFICVQTQPVL